MKVRIIKHNNQRPLTANQSHHKQSEGNVIYSGNNNGGMMRDYLGQGVKYEINMDFELSDEFKKFKEFKESQYRVLAQSSSQNTIPQNRHHSVNNAPQEELQQQVRATSAVGGHKRNSRFTKAHRVLSPQGNIAQQLMTQKRAANRPNSSYFSTRQGRVPGMKQPQQNVMKQYMEIERLKNNYIQALERFQQNKSLHEGQRQGMQTKVTGADKDMFDTIKSIETNSSSTKNLTKAQLQAISNMHQEELMQRALSSEVQHQKGKSRNPSGGLRPSQSHSILQGRQFKGQVQPLTQMINSEFNTVKIDDSGSLVGTRPSRPQTAATTGGVFYIHKNPSTPPNHMFQDSMKASIIDQENGKNRVVKKKKKLVLSQKNMEKNKEQLGHMKGQITKIQSDILDEYQYDTEQQCRIRNQRESADSEFPFFDDTGYPKSDSTGLYAYQDLRKQPTYEEKDEDLSSVHNMNGVLNEESKELQPRQHQQPDPPNEEDQMLRNITDIIKSKLKQTNGKLNMNQFETALQEIIDGSKQEHPEQIHSQQESPLAPAGQLNIFNFKDGPEQSSSNQNLSEHDINDTPNSKKMMGIEEVKKASTIHEGSEISEEIKTSPLNISSQSKNSQNPTQNIPAQESQPPAQIENTLQVQNKPILDRCGTIPEEPLSKCNTLQTQQTNKSTKSIISEKNALAIEQPRSEERVQKKVSIRLDDDPIEDKPKEEMRSLGQSILKKSSLKTDSRPPSQNASQPISKQQSQVSINEKVEEFQLNEEKKDIVQYEVIEDGLQLDSINEREIIENPNRDESSADFSRFKSITEIREATEKSALLSIPEKADERVESSFEECDLSRESDLELINKTELSMHITRRVLVQFEAQEKQEDSSSASINPNSDPRLPFDQSLIEIGDIKVQHQEFTQKVETHPNFIMNNVLQEETDIVEEMRFKFLGDQILKDEEEEEFIQPWMTSEDNDNYMNFQTQLLGKPEDACNCQDSIISIGASLTFDIESCVTQSSDELSKQDTQIQESYQRRMTQAASSKALPSFSGIQQQQPALTKLTPQRKMILDAARSKFDTNEVMLSHPQMQDLQKEQTQFWKYGEAGKIIRCYILENGQEWQFQIDEVSEIEIGIYDNIFFLIDKDRKIAKIKFQQPDDRPEYDLPQVQDSIFEEQKLNEGAQLVKQYKKTISLKIMSQSPHYAAREEIMSHKSIPKIYDHYPKKLWNVFKSSGRTQKRLHPEFFSKISQEISHFVQSIFSDIFFSDSEKNQTIRDTKPTEHIELPLNFDLIEDIHQQYKMLFHSQRSIKQIEINTFIGQPHFVSDNLYDKNELFVLYDKIRQQVYDYSAQVTGENDFETPSARKSQTASTSILKRRAFRQSTSLNDQTAEMNHQFKQTYAPDKKAIRKQTARQCFDYRSEFILDSQMVGADGIYEMLVPRLDPKVQERINYQKQYLQEKQNKAIRVSQDSDEDEKTNSFGLLIQKRKTLFQKKALGSSSGNRIGSTSSNKINISMSSSKRNLYGTGEGTDEAYSQAGEKISSIGNSNPSQQEYSELDFSLASIKSQKLRSQKQQIRARRQKSLHKIPTSQAYQGFYKTVSIQNRPQNSRSQKVLHRGTSNEEFQNFSKWLSREDSQKLLTITKKEYQNSLIPSAQKSTQHSKFSGGKIQLSNSSFASPGQKSRAMRMMTSMPKHGDNEGDSTGAIDLNFTTDDGKEAGFEYNQRELEKIDQQNSKKEDPLNLSWKGKKTLFTMSVSQRGHKIIDEFRNITQSNSQNALSAKKRQQIQGQKGGVFNFCIEDLNSSRGSKEWEGSPVKKESGIDPNMNYNFNFLGFAGNQESLQNHNEGLKKRAVRKNSKLQYLSHAPKIKNEFIQKTIEQKQTLNELAESKRKRDEPNRRNKIIEEVFEAIERGNIWKVSDFLNSSYQIEDLMVKELFLVDAIDMKGNTLLNAATQCGQDDIVLLLLKYNCDPNIPNYELNTPLHYASEYKYYACIELLLDHGADENAKNLKKKVTWEGI